MPKILLKSDVMMPDKSRACHAVGTNYIALFHYLMYSSRRNKNPLIFM